ncbi:hypothetical protein EGK63_12660 [Brevundimonas sp. 357]|nr:hypothetical protein EGK63_12660 [Brevundimonas sp. 357]
MFLCTKPMDHQRFAQGHARQRFAAFHPGKIRLRAIAEANEDDTAHLGFMKSVRLRHRHLPSCDNGLRPDLQSSATGAITAKGTGARSGPLLWLRLCKWVVRAAQARRRSAV